MRLKHILGLTLLVAMAASATSKEMSERISPSSTAAKKPNVLFILVDDLGWQDVGFMGSEYYQTPNIDSLAEQGMKFSDAYSSSANCAPTRAALFSGLYASRTGVYTVAPKDRGKAKNRALLTPENEEHLAGEFTTLAESFKLNGYITGFFGKWHLGEPGKKHGPLAQGFDVNLGGFNKGHPKSYFSPYKNPVLKDGPKGEYLTDRLTTEVIEFIQQKQKSEQPFFAFLSYYAVHTPLQAKKSLVPKYEKVKRELRQGDPRYAAMVETLDNNIGRILFELKRTGVADNTLIVFTSDNGGSNKATRMPALKGAKGSAYEGGVRVPLVYYWPKNIKAGWSNAITASIDHYPTLQNLAAHKVQQTQLDGVDLSPALIGSGDDKHLTTRALHWHFPFYLAGTSSAKSTSPGFVKPWVNSPSGWRAEPASSIRVGQYKLIEWLTDGSIELYDLEADLAEQHNLAEFKPKLATSILKQLQQWRKEYQVAMPLGANPKYVVKKK